MTEPAAATARAHWTATGPVDAPALVFVHGSRLSRSQWIPQVRRLSRRYRCVTLDLPGHGTRRGEAFTFEAATAAVDEAIEGGVPAGRVVLVGLSLGGYVAIEVAARRPERVAGLVLAGCSAEPNGGTAALMRTLAWAFERVPGRVLEPVSTTLLRARYPPAVADPVVVGGYWHAGAAAALRVLVRRRFLERVARLWTPILVVNGTLDPVFGPGGEPWAAAARRGRSVVIPWAGHLSPLDRPATFARHVDAFARRVFAEA